MEKNDTLAPLILAYPPIVDKKKKTDDLAIIWPEMEKFNNGKDAALFKKFSSIVYPSFTNFFLKGRTPEQHYSQLRYLFDFFMRQSPAPEGFKGDAPGAIIKISSPPESSMPLSSNGMAFTCILIHTADSPFLFENLRGYLNLTGLHLFGGIHPVMTVKRENGKIIDILPPEENGPKEVLVNFSVRKIVNPNTIAKLETEISCILKTIFLTVSDFHLMTEQVFSLSDSMADEKHDPVDASETAEFLRWLVPHNFIFMGLTKYRLEKKGTILKMEPESRMGVYRDTPLMENTYPGLAVEIEKRILNAAERPYRMVFDFLTTSTSIIYHREPVDVIYVRQLDGSGKMTGVTVLVGRLGRGAQMSRAADLPLLRKKFQRVMETEKIRLKSYYHREITTAFNIIPKRELFYIDRRTLGVILNITANLQSDDELHLIFRHNEQFEYVTAILVFSSKKYGAESLLKIREYLVSATSLDFIYDEATQSSAVAQYYLYFKLEKGKTVDLDTEKMAKDIRELITTWDQLIAQKVVSLYGDQEGFRLLNTYRKRLTELYKEAVRPGEAAEDLFKLQQVEETGLMQMDIRTDSPTTATMRIYWNRELDLMKLIPTLSNLGIFVWDEVALPLPGNNGGHLYIQLLTLEDSEERVKVIEESKVLLTDALQKIINKEVENCSLNRLILSAGLDWKKVDLIRAYRNYLLQISKTANPISLTATLNKYPSLVSDMVAYFHEKFDPSLTDGRKTGEIKAAFEKKLDDIADLMEDSILRQMFNIMENTFRTNYFKKKKEHGISFKIGSPGIIQMPKPVPYREIYVHSAMLEGIHLRGGPVARGGLRWSDRMDDFRTEILGLMKTQMVKNSVIVPVGSKGGFVIQKLRGETKEERDSHFKELYQSFIQGLLDLTDNIKNGETVPPEEVVCYDDPDPYLVVAADKGTSAMSDAANEISRRYGFWLGDAFASGGAVGYDHKKYGITARGAWECIKRHFRELDIDIQTEPITVAGVGGMSGDVFGNGVLLSDKLKLLAAFDSRFIFLDPDPDPDVSFKERKRLFELPWCKWSDYDRELISPGGGVYSRTAKAIPISDEMKKVLGVKNSYMSGQEILKAILKMRVDLLYFGAIGTYVRSSDESNLDVGDKTNDPIRVTAKELKARVIGEGANLSMTQQARIEYAVAGGICNTDAIDNSAGVDISDHEVNIKILLELLLAKKEIKTEEERNRLFTSLGPVVAPMVLVDNYLQSSGISLSQERSIRKLEQFCDYVDEMSAKGLVDREDENIPPREEILSCREKPGHLPRPIISVLFGYEKLRIKHELLASGLLESSFLNQYFYAYFPQELQRDYGEIMHEHRLKREIIATAISNRIVNQAGVLFIYNMQKVTGATVWEICRAYLIAENLLLADDYRGMIHSLDNKVKDKTQREYLLHIEDMIARIASWMLIHMKQERISFDFIGQYRESIKRFKENLLENLENICSLEKGCLDEKISAMEKEGIPAELGRFVVILPYLKDLMSIITLKEQRHTDFIETGNLFILITNTFELGWLYEQLEKYPVKNQWEQSTVENLIEELETHQSTIVTRILDFKRKEEPLDATFRSYLLEKNGKINAYQATIEKVKAEKSPNLIPYSVIIRQLAGFT